jgi:hypothetical protein
VSRLDPHFIVDRAAVVANVVRELKLIPECVIFGPESETIMVGYDLFARHFTGRQVTVERLLNQTNVWIEYAGVRVKASRFHDAAARVSTETL